MKYQYLFLFLLLPFGKINAQTKKVDSLLDVLHNVQGLEFAFHNNGMYQSYRGKHKLKEDNTIFFNSMVAFTLQNIKPYLSEKNKLIDDTICNAIIPNYKDYKNQKGDYTYNFWQTNPPNFFPHSKLLSHNKKYNIPDDADCTSLIYLTDTTLRKQNEWLHTKFSAHANGRTSTIKTTFKKYKNKKAYSTWFGKKMPIEFDICVQTNMLYFVYENKFPLNENDKETISLLREMILSGDYIKYSYYLSPSYKQPSIVLYHLARLLNKFEIPELNDCREKIKHDIESELESTDNFMEKVILSSSLIRMGGMATPLQYPLDIERQMNEFVFFRADLFSTHARPSLKFISGSNMFAIPFHCTAHCAALWLEYEALENGNQKL